MTKPVETSPNAAREWTRFREIPFSLRCAFELNIRGPATNPRAPEMFAAIRRQHRMGPL